MPKTQKTKDLIDLEPMQRLLTIMARLRDPDGGCPWDLQQTFDTIAPYTIEEAYEVADAIEHGRMGDLRDELGDLLLQVVFHAQIAKEQDIFSFDDVLNSISDKMVKRHPHVFGSTKIDHATVQSLAWEEQKAAEREEKAGIQGQTPSALDGVATALPALTRALKLQNRAARIGFDWPETAPVLDKVQEEIEELQTEIETGDESTMMDEMGDILFSVVNLARHLKIDPEAALRTGNNKFERRFKLLEKDLARRGDEISRLSIATLESAWQNIKSQEIQ